MDDEASSSPASYIRLVQHLIEKCICYKLNKEECMETLQKHANIMPVITSTVWKELEKENREFFDTYKKDRGGEKSSTLQQKNPSDEQEQPSASSKRAQTMTATTTTTTTTAAAAAKELEKVKNREFFFETYKKQDWGEQSTTLQKNPSDEQRPKQKDRGDVQQEAHGSGRRAQTTTTTRTLA